MQHRKAASCLKKITAKAKAHQLQGSLTGGLITENSTKKEHNTVTNYTLYSKQETQRQRRSSRRLSWDTDKSLNHFCNTSSSAFFSTHSKQIRRLRLDSAEKLPCWRPAWKEGNSRNQHGWEKLKGTKRKTNKKKRYVEKYLSMTDNRPTCELSKKLLGRDIGDAVEVPAIAMATVWLIRLLPSPSASSPPPPSVAPWGPPGRPHWLWDSNDTKRAEFLGQFA